MNVDINLRDGAYIKIQDSNILQEEWDELYKKIQASGKQHQDFPATYVTDDRVIGFLRVWKIEDSFIGQLFCIDGKIEQPIAHKVFKNLTTVYQYLSFLASMQDNYHIGDSDANK